MSKFSVGDLVVLKRDFSPRRRVFRVLAVSEIYDHLKLVDREAVRFRLGSYSASFWWPMYLVRHVSFYQPDLNFRGC